MKSKKDCFVCRMLIRRDGLRNFCDLKNKPLSINKLRKSCKHFVKYPRSHL